MAVGRETQMHRGAYTQGTISDAYVSLIVLEY
jgi:hypothetical protein